MRDSSAVSFNLYTPENQHFRTWKWMLRRRSFPFGILPIFRGLVSGCFLLDIGVSCTCQLANFCHSPFAWWQHWHRMDVCPPTAALPKTNIPSAPKEWCSPTGISISRVSSFRGELLVSGRVQSAKLGDFRWIMGGSPEPHESTMFGVTKPCSDSSSIGQSGSIYIPWDIFINLPCKVSTNKWHLISNQSRCHIIVEKQSNQNSGVLVATSLSASNTQETCWNMMFCCWWFRNPVNSPVELGR